MDTLETLLLSFISKTFRPGRIFFLEDLEPSGIEPEVLRVLLSRLASTGNDIVRLCRGCYCYPLRQEYSNAPVLPVLDEIVSSLASRWKVRIAPCGAQAAWLSGLTSLQLNPLEYISDGSEQSFSLIGGKRVVFMRRKSVKVFEFSSERLRNLVEGLRYIGKDGVGDRERGVVSGTLFQVDAKDYLHDYRLCPLWIRELFQSCRPVA